MTRHLPEQTRRDQILQAARKCFVERGYHPTRMEDIAAAAGLSKGGIYFHFNSKHEVFEALVDHDFQHSIGEIRAVTSQTISVPEKLQRLAASFIEAFQTAPDSPRFFIVMAEMALRDEAMSKKLLERQSQFISEIQGLLEQGMEEGIIRRTDPRVSAAMLKALIDGIEALSALAYPVETHQILKTGLELVMDGLLARP